jgi:transposase
MGRVRKKYPREFKVEAVKLMQKGDCSTSELARRLNVKEHDLRQWRKEYEQKQDDAFPGKGRRSGSESELARLKREVEELREERDILKKAAAYFARMSK